ncbi:MAG TPA: aldehyde dehydrogenase family protein [Cyclobacteriaceae bacterium]|nr:aldehyde dehydrogenase family protein [Cyclobacteriaceae bacterium]
MANTLEKQTTTDFGPAFRKLKDRSQLLRSEEIAVRASRLEKLDEWLRSNQSALEQAVFADLGKPAMEVSTSELFPVLAEINHAIENLQRWTRPTKIDAPLTFIGTRSEVRYEPKGACLIIAPWNYPFNLCIGPLVSCIAAGNTALVKPSELTPNTSAFIKKLVSEVFEEDIVTVVEGDATTASALLELPFDHIFFTGSPAVGKIIMHAAADRLASVTLELGGKSPAIVDASADLKDAAKRIAFGKFLNNGQTCIAPDYILVDNSVKEKFMALLKESVSELFGRAEDYGRIINLRHFARLSNMVKDAINKGATPALTGEFRESEKFFPPTILTNVTDDMLVMEEEIFGPVLPVIGMDTKTAAIPLINSKPKPLSLYIFSHDRKFREKVLKETSAGGVCINDCVLQFIHPNLPFGGVNNSGIGKAHGHAGFLAFTNEKPIVRQKSGYSNAYLFYPPYTSFKRKVLGFILRWFL